MRYANPKEVAAATGRSLRTVEDWCRMEKIKARKVGEHGHWSIAVDEEGWPLAYGATAEGE